MEVNMEKDIFISWSGERSKKIAACFHKWLNKTLNIKSWFSDKNIIIGQLWEPEIQNALKAGKIGVFFITKDNVFSPWINFEAGAISKGDAKHNVCIVRIDQDEIPKESPLFHYQNCMFDKEGIYNLINNVLRNKDNLPEKSFKLIFDKYWGNLYEDYLKIIYSENPLKDKNYIPKFRTIIPEDKIDELRTADKRNINNFFIQEYEKIDPNSIGERLQFIIDRAVVFVYLENNECWGNYLYKLEYTNNDQRSKDNYQSYNIAIMILREVFSYHKMMRGAEDKYSISTDPEDIKNALLDLSDILEKKPDLIKNKMLFCLLYDYLGLCCMKTACKQISYTLNKDFFNILDKKDRTEFENLCLDESSEIIINIQEAIYWFDRVLELTEYDNKIGFKQMSEYIWNDYALYNKARNQFLLCCLGLEPDNVWKMTMEQAVKSRKDSVKRYQDLPFAIFSNLYAEYLHAQLEQFSYLEEIPGIAFEKEYNKWIELCYGDVLNVQNKYEKVKYNLTNK